MSETFAELFEQSLTEHELRPGAIVMGRVMEIRDDAVVINAGLKSEGIVPINQFQARDGVLEVSVGDEIEVALDAIEDGFGETRLSREKAKRSRVWTELETAHDAGATIMGQISGKVKGGFTVNIDTIRAFLPGSLVDVRPVRDPGYLEGKDLEFKIIKLDRRRNNLVVSRRAVVEHEYAAERDDLMDRLTEGAVIKGVVKNLTDYGAFLDLGGVDGLLHITDMAWKRVRHPSEIVEVGQELEVRVLRFDRDRMRVSLGLKQLGEDPWSDIDRRYPPTARLFGKVTNITDYGCFVEIEDGVEGLVHVSEMDWTNKNANPAKVVHVGQEVEVMVLDVDEERRRISLGMKQCQPNPWDAFAASYNKGDKVSGAIKSITDFGIFIGLEGGIDGLIHLSDISWMDSGDDVVRDFKKGEEIEAVVLAVDPERERISLGIKQMDQDPFATFMAEHPKGSTIKGTVESVDAKGAHIAIAEGVQGYIKASDLSADKVDDATKVVSVGDEIEAKFVSIDRKTRQLALSVRAKDEDELAGVIDQYQSRSSSAGTSLGDLLKEQMDKDD
jgi:small subunit ribosomal protein S1